MISILLHCAIKSGDVSLSATDCFLSSGLITARGWGKSSVLGWTREHWFILKICTTCIFVCLETVAVILSFQDFASARGIGVPVKVEDDQNHDMEVSSTMLESYLNSLLGMHRLVYLFAKRRRRPKNDGSCRCKCQDHSLTQPGSGHLINNSLSSHQFVPYSHQQKYIWTVESDPIYEDIKEVKKKPVSDNNNYTKVTKEPKKSLSNSSSMSTVQYGVITAKEVAKFVPCTDINIRRW